LRLVLWMTVDAGAEATSGSGPDTSGAGVGSDTCDESEFKKKVAGLGLEGVLAYVPVKRKKAKLSEAAENKRTYRAQRKAQGFGQYVVEIPEDEEAKNTVYAVAKPIEADKDNTNSIRSTILSFVSCAALLELAQLLSASEVDVSSIIELIARGDLATITAVREACPSLLDEVSRLAKSNSAFLSVLDCLVRHAGDVSDGSARDLLEAAAAASGYPEVLRFVAARQRGGLRARLLGWALGGVH
jgi:hypothetical protein